jgi:ribosomal protein S9
MVQTFGKKKTAIAVAHVKAGKGKNILLTKCFIKVNFI